MIEVHTSALKHRNKCSIPALPVVIDPGPCIQRPMHRHGSVLLCTFPFPERLEGILTANMMYSTFMP